MEWFPVSEAAGRTIRTSLPDLTDPMRGADLVLTPPGYLELAIIAPDGRSAYVLSSCPTVSFWNLLIGWGPIILAAVLALVGICLLWRWRKLWAPGGAGSMDRCPRCSYPVKGLRGPSCPECGLDISTGSLEPARSAWVGSRRRVALLCAIVFLIVAALDWEAPPTWRNAFSFGSERLFVWAQERGHHWHRPYLGTPVHCLWEVSLADGAILRWFDVPRVVRRAAERAPRQLALADDGRALLLSLRPDSTDSWYWDSYRATILHRWDVRSGKHTASREVVEGETFHWWPTADGRNLHVTVRRDDRWRLESWQADDLAVTSLLDSQDVSPRFIGEPHATWSVHNWTFHGDTVYADLVVRNRPARLPSDRAWLKYNVRQKEVIDSLVLPSVIRLEHFRAVEGDAWSIVRHPGKQDLRFGQTVLLLGTADLRITQTSGQYPPLDIEVRRNELPFMNARFGDSPRYVFIELFNGRGPNAGPDQSRRRVNPILRFDRLTGQWSPPRDKGSPSVGVWSAAADGRTMLWCHPWSGDCGATLRVFRWNDASPPPAGGPSP